MLAAHTPGDTDVTSGVDGFYGTGTDYDNPNRNLTFNYRNGPFQRRRTTYTDPPSRTDEFYGINFLPEDDCLTCSLGFPDSFFLFDHCPDGKCDVPFLRFRESHLADATSAFDEGVYSAMGQLSPSSVWVAASEPRSWRGTTGLVWAAVSSTATGVDSVIEWRDRKLVRLDVGTPQTQPSSRTDFGVALSRERRAVYVVGGLVKGTPIRELWVFDVDNKSWSGAEFGAGGPEVVLAATYLPAEDELLVLDLFNSANGLQVRLLRVSLDAQTVTTIDTWDRTLTNSTFAITSFDDGQGYAVACTDMNGDHTLLRFVRSPNGTYLESYSTSSGPLMSSMIGASALGVTVLADPSGLGVPTPAGYALEAFASASSKTPMRCF